MVRDTLLRGHCLGYLSDPYDSPIAVYLSEQFPEVDKFAVDEGAVLWGDDGDTLDAMEPVAPAVSEFVKRFDAGQYPELVIHGEGF